MFEYTLLPGVNDTSEDARSLAQILQGIPCKINLLMENSDSYSASQREDSRKRLLNFQHLLRQAGYTVFIRQSRGEDISAACGQLAGKGWDDDRCCVLD